MGIVVDQKYLVQNCSNYMIPNIYGKINKIYSTYNFYNINNLYYNINMSINTYQPNIVNNNNNNDVCTTCHDVNMCDKTLGIDNLVNYYTLSKNKLLYDLTHSTEQLLNEIWKITPALALDNECRCCMGTENIRTLWSCSSCATFRKIVDFSKPFINKTINIVCGKLIGQKMIFTKVDDVYPYLYLSTNTNIKLQILYQYLYNTCFYQNIDFLQLKILYGDRFTTRALVQWIIEHNFKQQNLPHSLNLISTFICRNTGYGFYIKPSIGSFDEFLKRKPLTPEIVLNLIKQLFVIFKELSKLNFFHGNPTIESLIFHDQPVGYKYDKIIVNGDFTLMLANLWQSSITYNNVHIYSDIPEIKVSTLNIFDSFLTLDRTHFIIPYNYMENFIVYKTVGLPILSGVLDFYVMFTTLMLNNDFYNIVINNSKIFSIWSLLWVPDNFELIHKRINERNLTSYYMLTDVIIKCNIFDILAKELEK
jgi:hypothetical protein